jgi:hypothetical protein
MAIENSSIPIPSSLVFTPPSNAASEKRTLKIPGEDPAPETSPAPATSASTEDLAPETSSVSGVPVVVTLTLRDTPYKRHEKQSFAQELDLFAIHTPEFPAAALGEKIPSSDRYRHFDLTTTAGGENQLIAGFKAFDQNPLLQQSLFLFNVIVALEWLPSPTTIQQLMSAFRSASDFLYDCTNGYMAFGQVIFANRTLLDKADIQIMASNRFHPRSLVNALNEPNKFSPIRLGRGLWSKNNSVVIPWNEPIAYRTIIHEWGHYALSLHDEYIDEALNVKESTRGSLRLVAAKKDEPVENTLVVPTYSVSLESIMATLDSSEIVPQQRKTVIKDSARTHLLNEFNNLYSDIGAALTGPANAGPNRLPLPLPQFYSTFYTTAKGNLCEERLIDINNLKISDQQPQHCWLYLLHRDSSGKFNQIVAQGAIDVRARDQVPLDNQAAIKGLGFELLGDTICDEVLAIGYAQPNSTGDSGVFVRRSSPIKTPLNCTADTMPQVVTWDATPAPKKLPVVTVIPYPDAVLWPTVVVKVRVVGGELPTGAWIIPPGPAKPVELHLAPSNSCWESEFVTLQQLDGLVVLQYGEGDRAAFWVCEYSHGGNPPTSVRKQPAPVSAGSSDGNLMLFCRTDGDTTLFDSKRVVTTRNYATFSNGMDDRLPNSYTLNEELYSYLRQGQLPGTPASYLFSVASNSDLPTATLLPTIIMYFDINSLEDEGDPIIHRYNIRDCIWEPLPTYSPRGSFYAAIPLDQQSGPTIVDSKPAEDRVEYYQLFLVKGGGSKSPPT